MASPLSVIVLSAFLIGSTLSSDHFYEKYFDGEHHDGKEYVPDVVLQSRARHVVGSCHKFEEPSRPESANVTFFHLLKAPAPTEGQGNRIEFEIVPRIQMCSPNFIAAKEIETLRKTYPSKDITINKGAFRTILVVHPFTRLASVYLNLDSDKNVESFSSKLKKAVQGFSSKVDFKSFVHFLLEANQKKNQKSEATQIKDLLKELLPYHYQCQICHKDLFPQFVLKLDDHFEEDYNSFAEDTGIEEEGIGAYDILKQVTVPTQDQLKSLYSQLTSAELDDLVNKYRVDLDIYQYSPKPFYSFVM